MKWAEVVPAFARGMAWREYELCMWAVWRRLSRDPANAERVRMMPVATAASRYGMRGVVSGRRWSGRL